MKQVIVMDTHDLITLLRGASVRLPVDITLGASATLELSAEAADDARQIALQLGQAYKGKKRGGE